LVERIQAGDDEAFAVLYLRYFDRVYAYARVILNDRHGAEDIAQQVFAKAIEALPRYRAREGKLFRAWLFTIARNAAVDELERRARSRPTDPTTLNHQREACEPAEGPLPFPDWLTDDELRLFVERLPIAQRQVLTLRYLGGFDYDEIAAILARTAVDVRSLHSRGVRFLRQRLAKVGVAETPEERPNAATTRTRWARVISNRRWALHR
jgi:RNA polymerase sigma-70 factor (ECF subfamily)